MVIKRFVIVFLSCLIVPAQALGQDFEILMKGDPAPFDGVLLSPESNARLLAKIERLRAEKQLEISSCKEDKALDQKETDLAVEQDDGNGLFWFLIGAGAGALLVGVAGTVVLVQSK